MIAPNTQERNRDKFYKYPKECSGFFEEVGWGGDTGRLKASFWGLVLKDNLSTRPRSRVAIQSHTAEINFGFVYDRLQAKPHSQN